MVMRLEYDSGADEEEKEKIYKLATPESAKLAGDPFGHAVLTKMIENGSEDHRVAISEKLQSSVFDLSNNRYGCRVIQKAIEYLPEDAQVCLVAGLHEKILDCVANMHGNHVIQILVKHMPPESIGFVLDAVTSSADKMAKHIYGCRVIQRLIERCPPAQLQDLTSQVFTARIAELAKDKHANYVVQCYLQNGRIEDKKRIIDVIRTDIVEFAKDKVASNVVEKCFEVSTVGPETDQLKESREALFNTVFGEQEEKHSPLRQLMCDKFGNYTVQCVIRYSRGPEREALRARIEAAGEELRGSPAGENIMTALKRVTESAERPMDAPGDEVLPSKGSALHSIGQCKPCAWFWKPQGCTHGSECLHCHRCPEGELRERKKAKRIAIRGGQDSTASTVALR